jgi:hypothetical protein
MNFDDLIEILLQELKPVFIIAGMFTILGGTMYLGTQYSVEIHPQSHEMKELPPVRGK